MQKGGKIKNESFDHQTVFIDFFYGALNFFKVSNIATSRYKDKEKNAHKT